MVAYANLDVVSRGKAGVLVKPLAFKKRCTNGIEWAEVIAIPQFMEHSNHRTIQLAIDQIVPARISRE